MTDTPFAPPPRHGDGLAAALVAAQADMPAVGKDGVNPHFRNRFVTLDNLIETTRPVLNRHGIAVTQFPSHTDLGAPTLVTRLLHGPSGESLEYASLLFGCTDMQKYGSALTYARRYAWAAALGIASDDDDDGNQAAEKPKREEADGTKDGTAVISEPQRKRLFALAKKNEVGEDRLREIVTEVTGTPSTAGIPAGLYDELCATVEMDGVPFG